MLSGKAQTGKEPQRGTQVGDRLTFTEWINDTKVSLTGVVVTIDSSGAARRKGITKNKRRNVVLGIRVLGHPNTAMQVPGYENLWIKNRAHCKRPR